MIKHKNSRRNYYKGRSMEFSLDSQKAGWKNDEAQDARFEQFLRLIPISERFTINDLGCGLGQFCKYLTINGYEFGSYRGYDLLEEMITECKTRFITSNTHFRLINSAEEMDISDYTVASGIFNLKFDIDNKIMQDYIYDTINIMDRKSLKGFSFNMLTKYSDKHLMKSGLYYSDPLLIFDFCKRNISKQVSLLHDYYHYDFTIAVKKDL